MTAFWSLLIIANLYTASGNLKEAVIYLLGAVIALVIEIRKESE